MFAALGAFLWSRQRNSGLLNDYVDFRNVEKTTGSGSQSASPAAVGSPPSGSETRPISSPSVSMGGPNAAPEPSAANSQAVIDLTPQGSYVGTLRLVVPVAGVRADQLRDTFTDSRSEGRVHDAIDIAAASGTPVVAVADGEIVKLFPSDRGGITIYQLSTDKKLVFYYAHLQRYADGIVVGKFIRQGEVIAYVGDTGNAGTGNFHLHFSISVIADPKRYWEGASINPYPFLRK
ncbi:MAG: M23 family metallopeptidase [Pyrinomonadaceae bacterium]